MKAKKLPFSTPLFYLLLTALGLFCSPFPAGAQTEIRGTVRDSATNETLVGVTVLVRGTNNAASTDASGRFVLKAAAGSVLLVRYIGYAEKTVTSATGNLLIRLSPSTQGLKEVLVLGYGSQRKADITSAVSVVDVGRQQAVPASNVSRLLQGTAPGVVAKQTSGQPGQELQVAIRGNSSLGASSDPLYVVDGFPVGTNVGTALNASDIETMTILKDAASTSVYGSRGANGVVLITTKNGKKEGFKLSVTSNNGFANVPDSRRIKMLDGKEFAQFKKEVFQDKIRYFENREPTLDEIPADFRNPEQTAYSTDWFKEILHQNAPFSDYNVSLTNGTEKTSSYLSLGYLSQQGALIGTDFNRITARVNLDGRVNRFINVGLRLSGAYSYQRNGDAIVGGFGNNIVDQALMMDPREPVYNEDGSYNSYIGGHDGIFGFPNPVQRLREEVHRLYKGSVTANSYIEVKPIKDLSFKTSLNGLLDDQRNHDFTPSTIAGFNTAPPRLASAAESFFNTLNYGMDNILTYSPTLKDHKLEVTVGHIFQKQTLNTGSASGNTFPDDLVEYISEATQRDGTSGAAAFSLESFLSRVNYSFKDRYLFTASFNREASSRFGSNNRWGSFPSASVGWRLSDESFFPKLSWLNDLKLRASYGVTGNNNIGNYTSQANIITSNYVIGNTVVPGAVVGSFPNPNLGWEESRQTNAGADISFLKGRISFSGEYYRKLTTNMLLNVEVPAVAGFGNIITNIGKVENRGLEFGVNYNDRFGELTFSTSYNMSFNRNKVLSIDGDRNELLTGAFYDGYNLSRVGQPIGLFYGYKVLGIYQNQAQIDATPHNPNNIPGTYQYLDGNGDGVISYDTRDMVIIGNPNPKFTWGWNVNFGYKRFDLTMFLNGAYGGDLYRAIEMNTANIDGVFNVLTTVKDRWRSEQNPGAGIQAGSNTYYFTREANSRYVYDGSYAWIKNITLGYTIPRIKNVFDAKVFVSVDNAFLITSYPGNNPEVNAARANNGSDVISPGRDGEAYPVPRTISFGTRINF